MAIMKPGRSHIVSLCACAGLALSTGETIAGGNHVNRLQTPPRNPLQIAVVPSPPPPTNAQLAAFAGPNPTGLQSAFPAGIPPPGTPMPPAFGTRSSGIGFGGNGVGYAAGAANSLPLPASNPHPGPYSAVEIAKSFIEADTDRDGSLTPAEAQHLAIMPQTFEGMDANHDGVVTRWEYEDAFR